MKDCNKVFFGERGLTSTSAKHLSNIANELIQETKSRLDSVKFVTSYVNIDSNPAIVLTKGESPCIVDTLGELQKIGKLSNFIAWVNEAVKAREYEISVLECSTMSSYSEWSDLVPTIPSKVNVSFDDILGTLSLKERNEYYEYQALSATIGKYIHKDGAYSKARKEIQDAVKNPSKLVIEGNHSLVYRYEVIDSQEVEDTFYELQAEHRKITAKLNSIKFSIEAKVKEVNQELDSKHREALESYYSKMALLNSEFDSFIAAETAKIGQLKIVIPNDLNETFELLNSIGSK